MKEIDTQKLPLRKKIAILKAKLTGVNDEEACPFIKNASKSLNYLHCLAKNFGSLRNPRMSSEIVNVD